MATAPFVPDGFSRRRFSLAEIDAAVSARLGPTRGLGNSQPACFNRQVAMYLAKHVGRWTTTIIGRYYNGRDHSTVCHGIQRIEALRETDSTVEALLANLKYQILGNDAVRETDHHDASIQMSYPEAHLERLADLIAERVCAYLERRLQPPGSKLE